MATDAVCERLFEPTSPLQLVQESAKGAFQSLVGTLASVFQQGTASRAPTESEQGKRLVQLARTTIWLPIEAEEWIGETMLEKVSTVPRTEELEGRKAKDYDRVRKLFSRLVDALPSDQAYKFRLIFSPAPSENLTTMPGGIIVAHAGLLRQTDGLVAALLAHEIAHVTKRHYTRQIQGYLADSLTISEVVETLNRLQASRDRWITWARGILTLEQLFTRFYADQELEADACIPRLVKAAGLPYEPPFREFRLWALSLESSAKGEDTERRFFEQRHPSGPDRAESLGRSFGYWTGRQATLSSAGAGSTRLGATAPEARVGEAATGTEPTPGTASGSDSSILKRGSEILGGLRDRLRKATEAPVSGAPPTGAPSTNY